MTFALKVSQAPGVAVVAGLDSTFFGQPSSFARPGFAVVGGRLSLGAVGVTSRHFSRLRKGLAGGVAGGGFALAALGFGFQSRLVQRFLLRRPVAVDLPVIQRILLAAVALVRIWMCACVGGGNVRERQSQSNM